MAMVGLVFLLLLHCSGVFRAFVTLVNHLPLKQSKEQLIQEDTVS